MLLPMDYFYVDIETELGEMLTYYVAAMDETHAEELATIAFENRGNRMYGDSNRKHLCL